jgi:predicted glycosyltransferase involved in capsule biosynthesis
MEDLSKITFITPIKIDSQERANNIIFCINYLNNRLHVGRHIVIEQDIFSNVSEIVKTKVHDYFRDPDSRFFYKTKLLNKGISLVETPYVCIYDADVYIPESSIIACMRLFEKDSNIKFIIPHTGIFYDIPNKFSLLLDFKTDILKESDLTKLHDTSPGGAFMARTDSIREIGGYNENMKSWGYEDDEIICRANIYGYQVVRPKSHFYCYHFHHYRGINSSSLNPYCKDNQREYELIKKMTKEQLMNHKLS